MKELKMEEKEKRRKTETPCGNPTPCLSSLEQAQAGSERGSESGGSCTLPILALRQSASSLAEMTVRDYGPGFGDPGFPWAWMENRRLLRMSTREPAWK